MVRRTTRLALVLLAVVAVAGLPVADDGGGATGRASASGPPTTKLLTTTDLLTTTEAKLTTTTTTTTITESPSATTTTRSTTLPTVTTTTTDDSLAETTTLSDSVTTAPEEVANETGAVTTETTALVNGTAETIAETGERANATGDSSAVGPPATDVMAVSTENSRIRLSVSGTSSVVGPSLSGAATDPLDGADDVVVTTVRSPGSATADGDAGTTTASDETTGPGTTTDRESGAATGDSSLGGDGPSDHSAPETPPRAPELAAGVGALTAAALLPQLADGLALAGNAGLVSASSAFAGPAGTQLRRGLRSRFDRFWRFVTAFRYSRWDDSDPLDHDGREALYEAIERSPGAYLSQLCESADVPVSTARHHLDVLEDEELVTAAKVRGKRRYYPGRADDVELVAALEDEGTAPVLHALARLGASHGGRLADELDRDPSTVSHHLSRLEDAGLVEREREGRAVVNRLASEAKRMLRGDEEARTGEESEASAIAD